MSSSEASSGRVSRSLKTSCFAFAMSASLLHGPSWPQNRAPECDAFRIAAPILLKQRTRMCAPRRRERWSPIEQLDSVARARSCEQGPGDLGRAPLGRAADDVEQVAAGVAEVRGGGP